MRKKIIAGNWKMNTSLAEALSLIGQVNLSVQQHPHQHLITIIAPPYIWLTEAARITVSTESLHIAAQNCHQEKSGAYTGEISAAMLASCGVKYAIIGHSERRQYQRENHAELLQKIIRCFEEQLHVIYCVGETLEERDTNRHFETVKSQLHEVLGKISNTDASSIIVAYEPIWAIGTGKTAGPDQAQEMHAFIRKELGTIWNPAIAEKTSILYGGSCNSGNADALFSCPDLDGGLIGGASLKAEEFAMIRNIMISKLA